jgi:hypothetical protein
LGGSPRRYSRWREDQLEYLRNTVKIPINLFFAPKTSYPNSPLILSLEAPKSNPNHSISDFTDL